MMMMMAPHSMMMMSPSTYCFRPQLCPGKGHGRRVGRVGPDVTYQQLARCSLLAAAAAAAVMLKEVSINCEKIKQCAHAGIINIIDETFSFSGACVHAFVFLVRLVGWFLLLLGGSGYCFSFIKAECP